jgi:hypothetical protein
MLLGTFVFAESESNKALALDKLSDATSFASCGQHIFLHIVVLLVLL